MPALTTSVMKRFGPAVQPKDDVANPSSKPDTDVAPSAPETESSAVLKAVRAHEHDRQRARKTVETRERKERKRKGAPCAARPCRAPHGRRAPGRGSARGLPDAEGKLDEARLPPVAREEGRGALDDDAFSPVTSPVTSPVRELEALDIEVLIKPAKVHKRKAEDFEVIPQVRSVIVLDDQIAATPELDEPWEHVTAEDEDRIIGPSYAQIVASAM